MSIRATMTGSWFRTPEIAKLLPQSPTGEISAEQKDAVEAAERRAIRDQVHPRGSPRGLNWVSNGELRKSGYTYYLPNRFDGFSKTERVPVPFPRSFAEELQESNPQLAQQMVSGGQPSGFELPKIESKLRYHGAGLAR